MKIDTNLRASARETTWNDYSVEPEHRCLISENIEYLKRDAEELEIAKKALEAIKKHQYIVASKMNGFAMSASWIIANRALNEIGD